MNRPHFRRHPRPDDRPPTDALLGAWSGLRYENDGLPPVTRYDAEWPSVRAAEATSDEWSSLPPVFAPHSFVGGDLAAMAAPLPGMARDDLGDYAEPVTVNEYAAPVPFVPAASDTAFAAAMESVRKVSRESERAYERIVAAIHELDIADAAFADGRAYESGTRCRTESAAMKRATEHLGAPDGARRAALVLAGYVGAEAWAV